MILFFSFNNALTQNCHVPLLKMQTSLFFIYFDLKIVSNETDRNIFFPNYLQTS